MKRYIKSSRLSHDFDEYQEWVDYDMKHYGHISKETRDKIRKAGFTITRDQYGDYEVTAATKVGASELSHDFDEYQKWVDYDMKRYGRVSAETRRKIRDAGFTITRDQYGDYEVTACDDIYGDTVKKGNKWVNRGDTGEEHGEFDTKKEADAQRRAMFVNKK